MSKDFIKLTIDVEYERSVMINVNEIVDIVEHEEYTQVNLKNTNYYRIKETVDEIYTEMYGTYNPPSYINPITPIYPDNDMNFFTITTTGTNTTNTINSNDSFISLTN